MENQDTPVGTSSEPPVATSEAPPTAAPTAPVTAAQSPISPSGTGKKKSPVILIVVGCLVVCIILAILAGAVWVFVISPGNVTDENSEDTAEENVDQDPDIEVDVDEDATDETEEDVATDETDIATGEAADDDTWEFPTGLFTEYTYQRFICNGYFGSEPGRYFIDVEYPADVIVNTNFDEITQTGECDLTFTYGDSQMNINYDVGEAYPVSLSPGFTEVLTVGSQTLVKTAMTLMDGSYSYAYASRLPDADCVPGEIIPDLAAPCAAPIHSFLPGASMVSVSIPETSGASERGDIADLFDDIAKRMHGGENL